MLADIADDLGHPEDSLQELAEAHTLIEQHEERWREAEVCRLRGGWLLWQPGTAPAEAEACRGGLWTLPDASEPPRSSDESP